MIYMEKLLDSNWLRAVQLNYNTSANNNTIMNYDWLKDNSTFLSQWYHVKWWRNFRAETLKKVFPNEKNGLKKDLLAIPPHKFFHVYV